MRRLWNEFKNFAMSGTLVDLALGFIIATALAKIIDSLNQNVVMQAVAVFFGQPDFTKLTINVNGGEIHYGAFLTDLVTFLMLAAVLFLLVKVMIFMGIGRSRIFSTQDCPFCAEQIAEKAIVCRHCARALVEEVPSIPVARARMDELNKRKLLPAARKRNGS